MQALLASQLPNTSRVRQFDNPDSLWTQDTFLLRDIEYSLRALMYGMAPKDKRGAEPKPILSPLEKKQEKQRYELQKQKLKAAKSVLGKGIGGR